MVNISDLYTIYSLHPQITGIARTLKKPSNKHLLITRCYGSARALTIASVFQKSGRTMLVAMEDYERAAYMCRDLQVILPADVYLFPTSHRLRQKSIDDSYIIQRTEVLSAVSGNNVRGCIIVTYPEALEEVCMSKTMLNDSKLELTKGQTIQETDLVERLSSIGFNRVDFVYEPGQFAVRGGIVDIYSYSNVQPYRIDFFGDEIDSIRVFDIETQLSKARLERAEIVGAAAEQDSNTVLWDYLPDDFVLVGEDFNLIPRRDNVQTIEFATRSYYKDSCVFKYNTASQPVFNKKFDLLAEEIKSRQSSGYKIYILSDSEKQTDRLRDILETSFIPVYPTLHEGFIDDDIKACFFTDHQIFERYHKVEQKSDRARQGKVIMTLKELNQLAVGDYVVHVDHGIGKFGGLVRTTVNGKPQEMIKLIYRGGDTIFVSIHSLHRISKYRGKEAGAEPPVSKLGSGAWERLKERTKEKVKDIARDLIKLYAARKAEKGFAFSPDSYLQHELEASFIYEDTPDQLKATQDLKHDMESHVPMDRLICGDVGFGKTELAMRAAFKAAIDGKQTVVLVPTTVLALQHYNSFRERFENFPVRVEYISRAKSPKESKQILQDLADGKIDIIIGTHKLVSKSVHFHDLGLLIIDEEQKFGVAVKEKLRSLKVNVDTLTLTATPIPRTLQFSLLGARDLSVMVTPPQNRYPIETTVITPADEDILKEAIELEMSRNGQVFYIHNRVSTLPMVAHQIEKLCPQARIAIAHGQMPTEEAEQILTDFINYDYDILVATSIIENGVDIPNANTIIISGAQHFGLSDLHQMRGRVGRSNRHAYCYLIAPSSELLTPDARRRLTALETFVDLGSGFSLAMQDLDIRGAGNMLGAEQSGFIADLGYETYQKILNEAVLELKENEFQDLFEDASSDSSSMASEQYVNDTLLESDLEIGFPPQYVESVSERIALYRELDSLQTEDALQAFKSRLIDRFGALPEQGEELLQVVRLRWLCMRLGIEKIVLKQERMTIYFPSNNNSPYYKSETFGKVLQYITTRAARCRLREIPVKEGSAEKRRSAVIDQVRTVGGAFNLLTKIECG